MEVLCSTTRTGPVVLGREDALLKLLPLLERSEAKSFIAAAKLAVRLPKRDSPKMDPNTLPGMKEGLRMTAGVRFCVQELIKLSDRSPSVGGCDPRCLNSTWLPICL